MFTAAVVTVSDKGSQGLREDTSGPLLSKMLKNDGYDIVHECIIPDDQKTIMDTLIELSDRMKVNLILTTGGTGFSMRDVTPEATEAILERRAPGLSELARLESLKITPKAALSRATSGIRKKSLIVNMPGSPKAAREHLEVLMPVLDHGLDILLGLDGECAQSETRK
ncbi:MogA/MoaB family molybdenum cofactor biosynthesis protein [Fusibacter sp. JL216-2]|uniref:MogA/MoaB family molybdenum cofactor biosynthesis protein n=1 Tax=Fusibacter sp. JL216-2 TaxID=3071453 RepID=UPI003D359032